MKIYRLTHSGSLLILILLRFFYSSSANNVTRNLNLLFNSKLSIDDGKNFLYFFLGLSVLISYVMTDKHKIFKGIYCLLIIINLILIVLCLKQF
jgi:hypothetical protein